MSNFEEQIVKLAESRNCVGVMCGHIHTAADRMYGNIHYLNSGDWVESFTAIVEIVVRPRSLRIMVPAAPSRS